jgi:hypothetical protein
MQTQKIWAKPELISYGSVQDLTLQISTSKTTGSGDTLTVSVPGQPPVVVNIPGGTPTSVQLGS